MGGGRRNLSSCCFFSSSAFSCVPGLTYADCGLLYGSISALLTATPPVSCAVLLYGVPTGYCTQGAGAVRNPTVFAM